MKYKLEQAELPLLLIRPLCLPLTVLLFAYTRSLNAVCHLKDPGDAGRACQSKAGSAEEAASNAHTKLQTQAKGTGCWGNTGTSCGCYSSAAANAIKERISRSLRHHEKRRLG